MTARLMVAVAVALVLAAGLVYYLTQVPPRVAEAYMEQARPEHRTLARAVEPVFDSFDARTFGGGPDLVGESVEVVRPADDIRLWRRPYHAVAPRNLRRGRRAIARAFGALRRTDRTALVEVGSPILLGSIGKLRDAGQIAEREHSYLERVQQLLRRYRAVLGWYDADRRARQGWQEVSVELGEVLARDLPTGLLATELDRLIERHQRVTRHYARTNAPADVRRTKRGTLVTRREYEAELKAVAAALRRVRAGTSLEVRRRS